MIAINNYSFDNVDCICSVCFLAFLQLYVRVKTVYGAYIQTVTVGYFYVIQWPV